MNSEGQSEIKCTEAFVRVWRNVLSQAGRTLKAWADPDDKQLDIIGDDKSALNVCTEILESEEATKRLQLLFGAHAKLFTFGDKDISEFVYEVINIARKARNQVFHFRNRTSFVKKLKSETPEYLTYIETNHVLFDPIRKLYLADSAEYNNRIYKECEGAKLNEYAGKSQLTAFLKLLENATASDVTLPRINRVLLRLENTKMLGGELCTLPF